MNQKKETSRSETTKGELEDVLLEEFRNSLKVGANIHVSTDSSDNNLLLSQMLCGK